MNEAGWDEGRAARSRDGGKGDMREGEREPRNDGPGQHAGVGGWFVCQCWRSGSQRSAPLSSGEGTADTKGQGIPPMRNVATAHSSRVRFISSKASEGWVIPTLDLWASLTFSYIGEDLGGVEEGKNMIKMIKMCFMRKILSGNVYWTIIYSWLPLSAWSSLSKALWRRKEFYPG